MSLVGGALLALSLTPMGSARGPDVFLLTENGLANPASAEYFHARFLRGRGGADSLPRPGEKLPTEDEPGLDEVLQEEQPCYYTIPSTGEVRSPDTPIPFARGALTDGDCAKSVLVRGETVVFTFALKKDYSISLVRVMMFGDRAGYVHYVPRVKTLAIYTRDEMAKPDAEPLVTKPGGHVAISDKHCGWYRFGVNKVTDKVKLVITAAADAETVRVGEVEIWGRKPGPDGPRPGAERRLLDNPSFEDVSAVAEGPAKGMRFPAGWDCRVCTKKGGQALAHEGGARTGKGCLLMRESAQGRFVVFQSQELKVGPYTLTAYVRTDSEYGAGAHIGGSRQFQVTREWRRISHPFMVTAASRARRLDLVGWVATGNVYWDDVTLTPGWQEAEYDDDPRAAWNGKPSPTVPGDIVAERPTHICLGFEWPIKGDYNRNGRVEVRHRRVEDTRWNQAHPLFRLMYECIGSILPAPNMYAGSIFDLEPGQEYEVHFKLIDPDGGSTERTLRARTRPWPKAFDDGRELHVYPPNHAGAKQQPAFTDLQPAYDAARPGDRVLVHAGLYAAETGKVSHYEHAELKYLVPTTGFYRWGSPTRLPDYRPVYAIGKKGTREKPIVIRAAGDGDAVFDGGGAAVLFDVTGADYNYFEGITARNAERLFTSDRSEGTAVLACTLEDCRYAIFTRRGCRDFTISDNDITGNWPSEAWGGGRVWIGKGKQHGYQTDYESIKMNCGVILAGEGHVACYNRVRRFWDDIVLLHWGYGESNRAIDIYNNHISEAPDDGIEIDGGTHNIRVFRNFCHNAHMGISTQPFPYGPGYIIRNVVYATDAATLKLHKFPQGVLVYNNTLFSYRGFDLQHQWQNFRFLNNLFIGGDRSHPVASGTPTPQTSVVDYNGYRATGQKIVWRFYQKPSGVGAYGSLTAFAQATGYEKHGVWGIDFDDFVNAKPIAGRVMPPGDMDLRLAEGSEAVDAGCVLFNVTDGYEGKAPDLGAYERGRPIPHYGPRR